MSDSNQQEAEPLYEGLMADPQCPPNALPFMERNVQELDQSLLFVEHNSSKMLKSSVCTGDYSNFVQDIDGKTKGKEAHIENTYQRVKWTDDMVKLLITALSYSREYGATMAHFQFKNGFSGKWRAISNVMIQRGYRVSPQQCEDKFNDLNKKYRRLNELLGRGTACQVVENPKLIRLMDLSNEKVVEVMKILRSRQLFYQEMWSYNNGNRLFLPHDDSVQNILKPARKGKSNCFQQVMYEISRKRMKKAEDHEVASPKNCLDCNRRSDYLPSDCEKQIPNTGMNSHLLDLAEQQLHIKEQRLELKSLLIESQEEDLELQQMRLENKMIELENQRLAFKLSRQEMSMRKSYGLERAES